MRTCYAALFIVLGLNSTVWSQVLYVGGTTYTQNFDSLANSPTNTNISWTDNSTLPGWYEEKGNNPDSYRAGDGSSNAGHIWSYGANDSTERALGALASNGTGTVYFGVRFRNNHTSWVLTSFTVSYTMEQWRSGKTSAETTFFEYKVSTTDTDVNGVGYTGNSSGDLVTVNLSGSGAVNGNDAANQTAISFTVTGITWNPGEDLWLRWRDPNDTGNDHGMAIDDFTFSAVPEPTTFALVGLGMGGATLVARRLRRRVAA